MFRRITFLILMLFLPKEVLSRYGQVQFDQEAVNIAQQLHEGIKQLNIDAHGDLNGLLQKLQALAYQQQQAANAQSQAAQAQARASTAGADAQVRAAEAQARAASEPDRIKAEADRLRAQKDFDAQRAENERRRREQEVELEKARRKAQLDFDKANNTQQIELEEQKRERLKDQQIRHKREEAEALAEIDIKNVKEKVKLIGPMLSQVMQDLPAALEIQKEQAIEVEKIKKDGAIESTKLRWDGIKNVANDLGTGVKNLMGDPKRLGLTAAFVFFAYLSRYGLPVVCNYVEARLKRPKIVSETSWGNRGDLERVSINDVILDQATKDQLVNIAQRIRQAHENNEDLFNVLFYGVPGCGKTMAAKALAYESGLDWAYMSGSEFTKITDANIAISELQKLKRWAENSPNGMMVIVDEAESFLAERTLPTTKKVAQDLLNAFLAAFPKPTAKKIMWVFMTNNPFMMDDAALSRIAERLEAKLPEQAERVQLLTMYLNKFGPENVVQRARDFDVNAIAGQLGGIAPREIEYICKKMVQEANAARTPLTAAIAQTVAASTKKSLAEAAKWRIARQAWINQQIAVAAH